MKLITSYLGLIYLVLISQFTNAALPEPLTIQDTDYPYPATKVIFVSVTGDDNNTGTITNPIKSIIKALSKASNGYTIVIREGIYREPMINVTKRVTLQPYPHEKVWLKGSVVVEGWIKEDNLWRKDGWTNQFCRECYQHSTDEFWNSINAAHPYAAYPDMVFINGEPLEEVGTKDELKAKLNTFLVDYNSSQIYMNLGPDWNPEGKEIEVAKNTVALRVGATGTIVRGLGFAQYASYVNPNYSGRTVPGSNEWAMVIGGYFDGLDSLTFEKNTFAFAAGNGFWLTKPNSIVRNNLMIYNGQEGMGGNVIHNSIIQNNRFAYNNFEHFNYAPEAAGLKITHTQNVFVEDNIFENNYCSGLWFDEWVLGATVVRNIFDSNENKGLFFEISKKAILASNILKGNLYGIYVMGSSDVKIYNNTFDANTTDLLVGDDDRESSPTNYPEAYALGVTLNTENVEVVNNLFSNVKSGGTNFFTVRDYTASNPRAGESLVSIVDYNAFYRTSSSSPKNLVEWWNNGSAKYYQTFASYKSNTGKDTHGFLVENQPQSPFFANTNDYELLFGSIACAAGDTLPEDVFKILSISDDEIIFHPNIGASLVKSCSNLISGNDVSLSSQKIYASINSGELIIFGLRKEEISEITVYNIMGNELYTYKNVMNIDTDKWPEGLYLLVIRDNLNRFTKIKILK